MYKQLCYRPDCYLGVEWRHKQGQIMISALSLSHSVTNLMFFVGRYEAYKGLLSGV